MKILTDVPAGTIYAPNISEGPKTDILDRSREIATYRLALSLPLKQFDILCCQCRFGIFDRFAVTINVVHCAALPNVTLLTHSPLTSFGTIGE